MLPDFHEKKLVGRVWEVGENLDLLCLLPIGEHPRMDYVVPDIHEKRLVGRVWEVGENLDLIWRLPDDEHPRPDYPDIHERKLVGRVWEVGEQRIHRHSSRLIHASIVQISTRMIVIVWYFCMVSGQIFNVVMLVIIHLCVLHVVVLNIQHNFTHVFRTLVYLTCELAIIPS